MRFSTNIEEKLVRYREEILVQSSFGQFSTVARRRTDPSDRIAPRRSLISLFVAVVGVVLAIVAFVAPNTSQKTMAKSNFDLHTLGGNK